MKKLSLTFLAGIILVILGALPASAATYYSTNSSCNPGSYRYVFNGYSWQRVSTCYQRPATPAPTVPTKPPAPPAPTTPPLATGGAVSADEAYIFQQVNAERAKVGLAPLGLDSRLTQTARAKSQDMIANNYFGHQSPTLGSPFDQMRRAGIGYRAAGENIAGNPTAAGAMTAWMNSAGHRANILSTSFTQIGIGVVNGGPYGKMLTQQFIGI